MYQKEVNARSPLRILEKSTHGGLGAGNLGVVMAPVGVGKTACLVQIGLDDLMRERAVVHVALGQGLEHVHSWYEALFDDLARLHNLDEADFVKTQIARYSAIQSFLDGRLGPDRLEKCVGEFVKNLGFEPKAILIDGYSWDGDQDRLRTDLAAFKKMAKAHGAELWMTAPTKGGLKWKAGSLFSPCDKVAELVDVALFLEPYSRHVNLRLLKDHGSEKVADVHLVLHADSMRIVTSDNTQSTPRVPTTAFTLLSGGAEGAEEEFGLAAEKYGLREVTYSFNERKTRRARGLVELTDDELHQGDVSAAYLNSHMHRKYPETPLFKKILQTIWFQVQSAGQVFCVGEIQPDQTVRGGTGWAAELARRWQKPLYVFDQAKNGWFHWDGKRWVQEEAPVITRTRFTGTGTRHLTDQGRAAIQGLFERSFARMKRN